MKYLKVFLLTAACLPACKNKVESVKPIEQSITESVYASGLIKSAQQYQAFATVSGIVQEIYVQEGDTVKKGQAILSIFNQVQKLNKENAELNAAFSDLNANQGKLNEAKLAEQLALSKLKTDSVNFVRQSKLWEEQIGSKSDLEQRELAFQNSKTNYYSAVVRSADLMRQLALNSTQSKHNMMISSTMEDDYTLKSEIDGKIYELLKEKGEIVSPQTPLAIVGDTHHFILEMQVDEYDIFRIKEGLQVLVSMDSYKGKVFDAKVTKIYPIMNERSKSFLVEAEFVQLPGTLYPNVSFEANIILQRKPKALLIPRNFLLNDSTVVLKNGDERIIQTGLKDYKMIEVVSGLSASDEIQKPKK